MHAVIGRFERDLYPKLAARRTDMPVVPSGARSSTLNINSIHGGQAEQQGGYPAPCVPDSCRMIIDRRLLIEESLDGVKGEMVELLELLVRERAGFRYDLRDIFEVVPTMADRDGPVARNTAAAIRRVIGRDPEFILAHQPDEYVSIDDMVAASKVMALSAWSLLHPAA